jgi:DNA-binding winged helix-turn-helix (wHTH) protein
MSRQTKRFYVFGVFRIDVTERVLFGDRGVVPLTPKAFDTLLVLVENSGHVLSKEELMEKVWPDSFVEENNLAQNK